MKSTGGMWDHDFKMAQEDKLSDAASAKLSELFAESYCGTIHGLLKEVGFTGSRGGTDRIHRDILRLGGGDIRRYTEPVKVAKAEPARALYGL
ncbi:MAG TPA: hypothetical protein VNV41_17570 [Candidatus Acidoferrales bacterium]|nr:hypothetical protein [Candidatus Acidoferrales bacterium]